jgi:hypothetical protein
MKDAAELCRGLLRKAESDRIAMDASLSAQALDAACFHAQQQDVMRLIVARYVPLTRLFNKTLPQGSV